MPENGRRKVIYMKKVKSSNTLHTDTVPVDSFWNLGTEREQRMHRIHAYPAKFPAFITTKALKYAKQRGHKVSLVADIFCGCGTVAYEARRNNIDFWGCDINPVATLIARAKSQSYATWRLLNYYERIIDTFKHTRIGVRPYREVNERIQYWYDPKHYRDLTCLLCAIEETIPVQSKYRVFFLVAFSNILKATSRWLTKSIKPQIDPQKDPQDVLGAFRNQCEFAISASIESDVTEDTQVHIETADFLASRLNIPKADMIVTSPPYVTSYEYADLHQLSALWLNPTKDYRDFRDGSIGSLHHGSQFESDLEELSPTGKAIVKNLQRVDMAKSRSVAKYFVDMQSVAKRSLDMLANGGLALFVIGNTKYSGVHIDNAHHLVESMLDAGFADVRIGKRRIRTKILTPYRDKAGRFTSDGRGRKVYGEEFVVIGQRSL